MREMERTRPSREVFQEALDELRHGRIPGTMPFVAAYIKDTTKELLEYTHAITECAIRQEENNKVLRQLAESYRCAVLREMGKKPITADADEPHILDYTELIQWLDKNVRKEQEAGRGKSARMLGSALGAVLLLVASGKGRAE